MVVSYGLLLIVSTLVLGDDRLSLDLCSFAFQLLPEVFLDRHLTIAFLQHFLLVGLISWPTFEFHVFIQIGQSFPFVLNRLSEREISISVRKRQSENGETRNRVLAVTFS